MASSTSSCHRPFGGIGTGAMAPRGAWPALISLAILAQSLLYSAAIFVMVGSRRFIADSVCTRSLSSVRCIRFISFLFAGRNERALTGGESSASTFHGVELELPSSQTLAQPKLQRAGIHDVARILAF